MRSVLFFLACTFFSAMVGAQSSPPVLLRHPTLSQTQIAFGYANAIWVADRKGGEARQLTAGDGTYSDPFFSPDGKWIAFNGRVAGNADVYIVPVEGGLVRRLTYHPGADRVAGWMPDGKQVLFQSMRSSSTFFPRLFSVNLKSEGLPDELPLPVANEGSFSPDQKRIAYVPIGVRQRSWKNYHGGDARYIWLATLSSLDIEKIPHENANDFNPMWVGNTVYFLSERNGPSTLFAYDTQTKKVRQVLQNHGLDIESACATPDTIVYEQFGTIHLLDLATNKEHPVDIQVRIDLPVLRPRFEKVGVAQIRNFAISPTGSRAAFEGHGEIFTVPAEKGDTRDLTNTPGAAEHSPAWSPNGKWIAYFSDASGDYELEIRNQNGLGQPRKIDLGKPGSFFYSPVWSPDSRKIAYTDKRSNLWCVDVEKGGPPFRIDSNEYSDRRLEPSWSPDSRWITYVKQLHNHLHAVYLYSMEQGKSQQVTDGLSDARSPVFDANGKYLYFTASTDMGLSLGLEIGADMSGAYRPITFGVYLAILDKSLPSPLPLESDEEKVADDAQDAATSGKSNEAKADLSNVSEKPGENKSAKAPGSGRDKPVIVKVDFENISQRILSLPIPARDYSNIWAGKTGVLYLNELTALAAWGSPATIQKFTLSKRKLEKVADNVTAFAVSFNGDKILLHQGANWSIASASDPFKPGEGALKLADLNVYVDPRAEWAQMYHETWRIERDFFYAPNFQGLDIAAAEKKYAAYLPALSSREDLTYLSEEMLGQLSVGHMTVSSPFPEDRGGPRTGLLGADYRVENGRYRFARIYGGENWNPDAHAPLTEPGVNVTAGEYLLAVNGRELHSPENIYRAFEGTSGKTVLLKVGPDPDGKNAREVKVVPIDIEINLRALVWMEDNRRKVDALSGGRLAYVWIPTTTAQGYNNFNRYYLGEVDKEGAIIDDRYNLGGWLADYMVDYMRRVKTNCVAQREGIDICNPVAGIFGPKEMIINEMSGSGGDALPWYFHKLGIGELVGKRTWGGLVGLFEPHILMDGGEVAAPSHAIYGLTGEWEVENHGVAPDVEVELDPKAARDGHDVQLERAVKIAMEELKKHPLPHYQRPPYPDYHQKLSDTANHP